jgi:23S rRNA G2445 N2-methylase RlmL
LPGGLTAPQPSDVICDPACGTAGFLVTAGEVLRQRHPNLLHDASRREQLHQCMFHGFDLSLKRYKEVVHEAVEHRAPKEILAGRVALVNRAVHAFKRHQRDPTDSSAPQRLTN